MSRRPTTTGKVPGSPVTVRCLQVGTWLCALALGGACTGPQDRAVDVKHRTAAVVFGEDGRQDFYAATDPQFAARLRQSAVAIVEPAYIDVSDPAAVVPNTVTLGEYQSLCDGERFSSQPAMASCSATLIDDDLVLTAGHCIDDAFCRQALFVFGFYMEGESQLRPLTAQDVYRCEELVVHNDSVRGDVWHDYAIVRLDRPVEGDRAPAPIEMDPDTVVPGDSITALGFGDGIPGKVHTGASVNSVEHDFGYFVGSTDTFAGNSGSGTYNADHEVVGVFVRGTREDYREQGQCQVVNTGPEDRALQEYSYAYFAVQDLCDADYPSERLCGDGVPDPEPDPEPGPDTGSDPEPDAGAGPGADPGPSEDPGDVPVDEGPGAVPGGSDAQDPDSDDAAGGDTPGAAPSDPATDGADGDEPTPIAGGTGCHAGGGPVRGGWLPYLVLAGFLLRRRRGSRARVS